MVRVKKRDLLITPVAEGVLILVLAAGLTGVISLALAAGQPASISTTLLVSLG